MRCCGSESELIELASCSWIKMLSIRNIITHVQYGTKFVEHLCWYLYTIIWQKLTAFLKTELSKSEKKITGASENLCNMHDWFFSVFHKTISLKGQSHEIKRSITWGLLVVRSPGQGGRVSGCDHLVYGLLLWGLNKLLLKETALHNICPFPLINSSDPWFTGKKICLQYSSA